MIIDRRSMVMSLAAAGASILLKTDAYAAGELEVGDNGLYIQDWFLESFLTLRDDHAEAAENNKHLAVLFEQRGCPYCRELHKVNLGNEKIRAYMKKHFDVVQLDLWGSRTVTDFDGSELEERALARKWRVNFTPTMLFFAREPTPPESRGSEFSVATMPGYLKPFHFISMLEYVNEGAYKSKPFQGFLQDKFKSLRERGIKPDVW